MGILLAILTGAFTVVGNYYAKDWAVKGGAQAFFWLMFWYTLSSVAFPFSLRYGSLIVLGAIVGISASVITTAISVLYFHETLTLPRVAGIVLGLVAGGILARTEK